MTVERQGSQLGTQHPANERALSLEQLPYVLSARTACDQ